MSEDGSMPNHMTYKIRQNASFTTTTNLVRSRFWFPGPRNWGYGYYQFGFVWIQVLNHLYFSYKIIVFVLTFKKYIPPEELFL